MGARFYLFLIPLLILAGPSFEALAQDSAGAVMPLEFETVEQRQRYQDFSKILRCPMCQNQNLSGSDAGIAADLRKALHRLVGENKTDKEIIDFMQSRYGNFILYQPPVNRATIVLWLGPAVLLLLGFAVARRMAKRGSLSSALDNSVAASLNDEDRQRARALLFGDGAGKEGSEITNQNRREEGGGS